MGPADLPACEWQVQRVQTLCTALQRHREITPCQGGFCLRDHHMGSSLTSGVQLDLDTAMSLLHTAAEHSSINGLPLSTYWASFPLSSSSELTSLQSALSGFSHQGSTAVS